MFEEKKSMLHNLVLIPLVHVIYRGEKGSNASEIIKKGVLSW